MQQLNTVIRAGDVADEIPEIDLLHGRRQGVEAGSLASRCITADSVHLAAVFCGLFVPGFESSEFTFGTI